MQITNSTGKIHQSGSLDAAFILMERNEISAHIQMR